MGKEISRVEEVPVFKNDYGILFNDKVVGPTGEVGRYLRWQWTKSGVVVIPKRGDEIALSKMYRYPIHSWSLEVPRGAIDLSEEAEVAAMRELQEETGLLAKSCWILGNVYPDTGLIENAVKVFLATVGENRVSSEIESMESIEPVIRWINIKDILSYIRNGEISCAITISALMLLMTSMEQF